MRRPVVTAAAAAFLLSSLSAPGRAQPDRVPPTELAALQTRVYSVPADVAFHATLATLQTLGFEDIAASKDAGTISAVTDSKAKTILNIFWGFGKKKWTTKAQLLVEDYGGGSQVRLGLSQKETKARGIFGTSFTDGETIGYAQPYQNFFAALDAEVSRRGGSAATTASVAKVDAAGDISVGGGVELVPAKTLSGYCIKAGPDYVGTGAANRPAVTAARPICN
jgi:hypothetical protein